MATVYGTDIRALDDLPDPEELCSEEENAAYAIARRHASGEGCLEEIGDEAPYDCFDIEELLDQDVDDTLRQRLELRSTQVTEDDEYVVSASSEARVTAANAVELSIKAEGGEGPFDLVIGIDKLSIQLLRRGT